MSKSYRIASHIRDSSNLVTSYMNNLLKGLYDANQDGDILDDAIEQGYIDKWPEHLFQKPEMIYWKVQKFSEYPQNWALIVYTPDERDANLIMTAMDMVAEQSALFAKAATERN